MSDFLCHDFKTPRTDTSRRLPSSFRMVPVAFYVALVGGAYFITMDMMNLKRYEQEKVQAELLKEEHDLAMERTKTEKDGIDAETTKAESLAKWVEGARNIQPIGVAISRAISIESRLSEVSLERSEQVPANLSFGMRLLGNKMEELAKVEASLSRLNYQSLSPQQNKDGEVIEYRSTLVRRDY